MIDLHTHSTASDGTLVPADLSRVGSGFAVMAITDHDNCDGVEEFLAAEDGAALRLAGIELSIDPGAGYRRLHMLGIGVDPASVELQTFLERILRGREERNREMLARFAAIGIEIPPDELAKFANGRIVARPHFAAWLVETGIARDKSDAFERFLCADSPAETRCYASRYRPSQEDAIAAVHAAGGVAVAAHPRFWTDDPIALRRGLAALKEKGLDGVEALYQSNSDAENVDHLRAASELGLAVTAGSDFHGSNKPDVHLGMKVDDERRFLEPFFAALESRRRS